MWKKILDPVKKERLRIPYDSTVVKTILNGLCASTLYIHV
ncbi:hypothetical protein NARC_110022 [Candidatus Nitrosocosmicus arcticus]|uniref:Uncharacterized protein n=1 Tax=Candidatus Nitrosocosmicus arcticus TaxID=2035267 RepID=A0A557ST74_9ARCH|nr:hypothetical protein NARC_110022 [Candidatus Nitrosocosmicus arcticus]